MKKAILTIILVLFLIIVILAVNLVIFEKKASVISEGEAIENYDSTRSAVLIIDIQEGITGKLSTSDYYVIQSNQLIDSLNKMVEYAKEKEIPVLYIQNQISNPLINFLNNSFAKGGPGSQFDERLEVINDLIFPKEKNDAFSNKELDKYLVENEISHLYFSGLDAAFCVNSTIQAALNRAYKISVISDALISESDSLKEIKIQEFQAQNIEIIRLNEFRNSLK